MGTTNDLGIQNLFEAISPIGPAFIVKVLIVIALAVYLLFAFILTRQVSIKRSTVETPLGSKLSLVAAVHLLASILLIIVAIIVL